MRFVPLMFVAFLLSVVAVPPAQSQPNWASGDMITETELVSDMQVVTPGQNFHVALHQIMPEGWHTYWRNPGDAGLPARIVWELPDGVSAGEIIWPAPHALPLGPIMDYGYEDEVFFPVPFQVSEDFSGSNLSIRADVSWLVCEDICIPEEGVFELTLAVGSESQEHPDNVWNIRAALDAEPKLDAEAGATLDLSGENLVLSVSGGQLLAPDMEWRNLTFFPFDQGLIKHAAPQMVMSGEMAEILLVLSPGYLLEHGVTKNYGGVLNFDREVAGGWVASTLAIEAVPGDGSVNIPNSLRGMDGVEAGSVSLVMLLLLALGGGLILNLMPCVFPVLSIKILKVVEVAHEHPNRVRRHGLYFLIGVVLSFVFLAGLLVLLREFGLPLGWGFQLQVPIVVAALALLLFAIGLNLLGLFEIGTSIQGVGGSLAAQKGGRGAFFTGILAVVVAAPCVGPLAAGALGVALTQPASVVLLVSAAMGLGLALPFLTLSVFPSLLRFVPKPGAWMDIFKQALAFPMFASALWMVWVLSVQSGSQGVLFIGISLLAFSMAIWALRLKSVVWLLIAVTAFIISALSLVMIARLPAAASTQTLSQGEEAWSEERVAALRASGQPVFIDVTAAWCVTCQINKLTVLDTEIVRDAFEAYDVVHLKADWTNRNDEIADLIARHGAAGVPLYLLFPANGDAARILPSMLTQGGVIEALADAAG